MIPESFKIRISAKSSRSKGELPLFSMFSVAGIEYLLRYTDYSKGQSPEITITSKV